MKTIYITTPAPQIENEIPHLLKSLRLITRVACSGQEAVMIVTESELKEVLYMVEKSEMCLSVFVGSPDYTELSNQIF